MKRNSKILDRTGGHLLEEQRSNTTTMSAFFLQSNTEDLFYAGERFLRRELQPLHRIDEIMKKETYQQILIHKVFFHYNYCYKQITKFEIVQHNLT
jgi:hypothetical protein